MILSRDNMSVSISKHNKYIEYYKILNFNKTKIHILVKY